ncbi:aromatic ring-hydroxylating dioxygenase subunit alpha [Sphingobium sp.]|uniref:aromatic ring-hydroxylating dioxygenase subunit alpha n=1 Tax=Sphingobium sp. TaxID=1912891 RepID=UPI002C1AC0D4|nr:aromatic ring-hydroxylating dioxygenase subunit alpha [Sphingobium sp.]HUD94715.1 aromatic ring-hydroxylating dioxygenase subunit alpha [Sphingobium sp.]
MAYLKNAWYVAAWDHEVPEGTMLSRRLLGDPILFFRDEAGLVKALHGVCPHRYAPLARGKLVGDMVQCGYHGLGFGADGACVHNPFGAPPKNMSLRPYPVVELHSAIWIWMGEADRADPALIPDFGFNDPETAWVGKGYLNVKAGYELEIENILDLSHVQFLHPTTLGSDKVSEGIYTWKQEGDEVWSNRDIHGEMMTPELAEAMGIDPDALADRWINVRWNAPANLAIFAGAVTSGRPKAEGREAPTAHLFTPETATSSHYWYSIAFPKTLGPIGDQMAQEQVRFLSVPFELEDLPMLEDQQANIGDRDLRTMKLGWLPGDAAGARARNLLYARIDAEVAARENATRLA